MDPSKAGEDRVDGILDSIAPAGKKTYRYTIRVVTGKAQWRRCGR